MCVLALGVLFAGSPLAGQQERTRDPGVGIWASAGVGTGTEGGAALIAVRVHAGDHLLSARTAGSFGITEGESRTDVGLLYGRRLAWGDLHVDASAGAAYVIHEEEDGTTSEELSVPLSLGAGWTPLPVIGLEVKAFGNVNPTASFGGVVLAVNLGLFR